MLAKGDTQYFQFNFKSEQNLAIELWLSSCLHDNFLKKEVLGNDFKCFHIFCQENFVQFADTSPWKMNMYIASVYKYTDKHKKRIIILFEMPKLLKENDRSYKSLTKGLQIAQWVVVTADTRPALPAAGGACLWFHRWWWVTAGAARDCTGCQCTTTTTSNLVILDRQIDRYKHRYRPS